MKKKIIFTLLIFVLAFISVFSIVKATNEDNGIMLINQNRMLGYEQIEDKDVYEATANIERKSQVINGNTYFCANNVMLSDVVINGDAFIVANTVTFENGTTINGNLFICASNVKIDGSYIERSIFAAVKDITFTETSSITYDANIIASHVIVNGTFDRNLNMAVDDIEVKERANILGTMNYTSNKEAVVEEGALIQNINFDKHVEEHETVLDVIIRYVLDFVRYFVLTMVIFILIMKF